MFSHNERGNSTNISFFFPCFQKAILILIHAQHIESGWWGMWTSVVPLTENTVEVALASIEYEPMVLVALLRPVSSTLNLHQCVQSLFRQANQISGDEEYGAAILQRTQPSAQVGCLPVNVVTHSSSFLHVLPIPKKYAWIFDCSPKRVYIFSSVMTW